MVTVAQQKGGVGKTTTAANIGVQFARQSQRVLLVDTDPQFALTRGGLSRGARALVFVSRADPHSVETGAGGQVPSRPPAASGKWGRSSPTSS
jgi:nitrogenase subunit NifH